MAGHAGTKTHPNAPELPPSLWSSDAAWIRFSAPTAILDATKHVFQRLPYPVVKQAFDNTMARYLLNSCFVVALLCVCVHQVLSEGEATAAAGDTMPDAMATTMVMTTTMKSDAEPARFKFCSAWLLVWAVAASLWL